MQFLAVLAVVAAIAAPAHARLYRYGAFLADPTSGDGGYATIYHNPTDNRVVVAVTLKTAAAVAWADFGSTAPGATQWNVTFSGNGALQSLSDLQLSIKSVTGWRVRVALPGALLQGIIGKQNVLPFVSGLFSGALVSSTRAGVMYATCYVTTSGDKPRMNYGIDGRGVDASWTYALSLATHSTRSQLVGNSIGVIYTRSGNLTTYSGDQDVALLTYAAIYEGKARFTATVSSVSPAATFSSFLDGQDFMAVYTPSQAPRKGTNGFVAVGRYYFSGLSRVWFNVMSNCNPNFTSVNFGDGAGQSVGNVQFSPASCQATQTAVISPDVKLLTSGKATSFLNAASTVLAQTTLPAMKYSFSDNSGVRVAFITGSSPGVSAVAFARLSSARTIDYRIQLQGIDPTSEFDTVYIEVQSNPLFSTKTLTGSYANLPPGFDFLFVGSNSVLINVTTKSNPQGMSGFLQAPFSSMMPTAPPSAAPTSAVRLPPTTVAPTLPPGRTCFSAVLSGSALSTPLQNGVSGYIKAEVKEIARSSLAKESNFYFVGRIAGLQPQVTELEVSLYSGGSLVSASFMTNVPLRNGAFSGVFRDLLSVDLASLDAGNLAFHVKTLRGDDVVEGPIRRCSQQPYDGMLSSVLSGVQAKKTTGAACFVSATSNLASRQIKFVAECAGLTTSTQVNLVQPTDSGDSFVFSSNSWSPVSPLSFTWQIPAAQFPSMSQLLAQNKIDVVIADTRGTLMVTPLSFTAIPAGRTEVPIVDDTTGAGITFAVLSGNNLVYEIYVSGLKASVIKSHIHGPASDPVKGTGPLIHDNSARYFAGAGQGTWEGLTLQQIEDLYNGYDYINIHTDKHTAGALRGHLRADSVSDAAQDGSPVLMAASMSSGFWQASGPYGAAGLARVSLLDQTTLEYHVQLSSVKELDSNVQSISIYGLQWDGSLVKLTDLDATNLATEESRGRVDLSPDTISLLASNRLYVRATSTRIVLQGQIFYRKRSFGFLGANAGGNSGMFGLAELDQQGNVHVTAALESNVPVSTVGIVDGNGDVKVDMTYALRSDNSFDGFWESIPLADLFDLSAGKLNFFFSGPRISPATATPLTLSTPGNHPTHFFSIVTDQSGGIATTLLYITDDNQLVSRFWLIGMQSTATAELQYYGTIRIPSRQIVVIPNPLTGNSTGAPPTITTETITYTTKTGWHTVGDVVVQLGSGGFRSTMVTIPNPTMDALQSFVSATARVVFKDSQNQTVAMDTTSVSHNRQFSLLSGANAKPTPLAGGAIGQIFMQFDSDGTLRFHAQAANVLGDVVAVALVNSSGYEIYRTETIIEGEEAFGVWFGLSVADFKAIVSGKLVANVVTEDYPNGEVTGVVSWVPFLEFARLRQFRGMLSGGHVDVGTAMVGEATAFLDADDVVLISVYFDAVSSPIKSIELVYENETTGEFVRVLGDAFLAAYAERSTTIRWRVPNAAVLDYLLSSKVSILVGTEANPTGEITGALAVVSSRSFGVVTANDVAGPAAGGIAIITIDTDFRGSLHVVVRFNNKKGEPISAKLVTPSGQTVVDLRSNIYTSNLIYGQYSLDSNVLYYLTRGLLSLQVSVDTSDPKYVGKTHMSGTLMRRHDSITNTTLPIEFEASLGPSDPTKASGVGGYFHANLNEQNVFSWTLNTVGAYSLLSVDIFADSQRLLSISSATMINVLAQTASGKVSLSAAQIQGLRDGNFAVVVKTRTSIDYNLEGKVLFRKKDYGGVFAPTGPTGMGGYARLVLDRSGWVHYEIVLSGLTASLSYIAYEYNDRNVSFLQDGFTSSRARGVLTDLTMDELRGIADGNGGILTVGVSDSTVSNPALVLYIVEFLERDSYLWFGVGPVTGQQVALADGSLAATPARDVGLSFVYVDNRGDVDFIIFWTEIESPISIGLYGPASAGYAGPMLREVTEAESRERSGKWINPGEEALSALARGQIYALVKSEASPNGEVRGQIVPQTHEFSAIFSSSQEVSPVSPTGSAGFGKFFIDQFGYLHYRIVVEGIAQNDVPAHIHGQAEFYENAMHVFHLDLQLVDNQWIDEGRWGPLGWSEIRGLIDGVYYVNVHTDVNKPGEIRGHIRPNLLENYYTPDQFEALLSGNAAGVVAAGAGYAQFWLDDRNNFFYSIEIVGTDVGRVAIRGPADVGKTSQNELFDLTDSFNGLLASGSVNFNANNKFYLTQRKLYILVSDSNGNPILRGQIYFLKQKFTAVLSQASVGRSTPQRNPVSAAGLASISVAKDGRFQYAAFFPNIVKYSATVLKQPQWVDDTWASNPDPSKSIGASQLVSDVQMNNLAYGRTTLEVQTLDPPNTPVVKGAFLQDVTSVGIEALLYDQPFTEGVLTILLSPGGIKPPSDFYLSTGGFLELIYDKTNSVLMYTISVDGVAGKVSKAHFYSPSSGATVLNLLPVIGAQSFNGHVMVSSSVALSLPDENSFSNNMICFQMESATQTGQLSKIGECITNTFVVPYCSDSGRQVDMNENAPNSVVTRIVDSFLFPAPSRLSYRLYSGDTTMWGNMTVTVFQDVKSGDGRLFTASTLDYERQHQHSLLIGMFDGVTNYCNLSLIVNVVDLNDNDPYFIPGGPTLNVTVYEANDIRTPIYDVIVNDPDGPTNGNPTVTITGQMDADGNDVNVFYVRRTPGDSPGMNSTTHIMTRSPLNYDACDGGSPMYTLYLEATDSGATPRTVAQTLVISVVDVNDQPPVFQTSEPAYGNTIVDETHPLGEQIQNYTVTDCDVGMNAKSTYSVIAGDPKNEFDVLATDTGFYLMLRQRIDAELVTYYLLTVQGCNDVKPRVAPPAVAPARFCSSAQINVTVLDIPFKIEIGIPPEFVQCKQEFNAWYSPSNSLSLTARSNEEDGVSTVPQFRCRLVKRSDQDCVKGSPLPQPGATCSVTCGRGLISAYRPILKPAIGSGKACDADPPGLMTDCQQPPCPTSAPTTASPTTAAPTTNSSSPPSGRRRRALPPGAYFKTASPYDQPPPLDLSNLVSSPFQNCGLANQLSTTFKMANLTEGEWEFQVMGRVRNPAQGVTATYNNSIAWIVDTIAPQTTIDSATVGRNFNSARQRWVTKNRNPVFSYNSNEDNAVFKCRMTSCSYDNYDQNGGCFGGWMMSMYSWIDCNTVSSTDPSLNMIQTTEVYGSPLPWDGWYRLEIAAIDCAGNRDSSPATHVFELDTEAPIVGIQAVPTRIITDTSTSIDLLKNDFYATFRCLVNQTTTDCSSGTLSLSGLAPGTHLVTVFATDEADNSASEATYSFHVEAAVPQIAVADPLRYTFTNKSASTVYLEAETVFLDLPCRNVRRGMQSLIRNCCMIAFGGKEISKDCYDACIVTNTTQSADPVRRIIRSDTCNAMMRNYTMCLKDSVNKVGPPTPISRSLYRDTCERGSFDMGRTIRLIDVYTFEVYALGQSGTDRRYFRKNYVYDPRIIPEETLINSPSIIIPPCDPPIRLLYIILVSVAWGLVLITLIIFIIVCARQRSGPSSQGSSSRRRRGAHAMRPLSAAGSRAEEALDISQFEASTVGPEGDDTAVKMTEFDASAVGPEDPYEDLKPNVSESDTAPIVDEDTYDTADAARDV